MVVIVLFYITLRLCKEAVVGAFLALSWFWRFVVLIAEAVLAPAPRSRW